MIQLAQFLAALNNLVRSGVIKKVPDAIKFAEQQFGKVTPLLKKQIERVFENIKKPVVGKPGKKEGAVLPMVKEGAKKAEGIETLDQSNIPEYDPEGRAQFEKDVKEAGGMEEFLDANPINPKRPGGSLDPATGITRALARRILDRKGIEIGKKDPIDVFTDTFGEAISDVNNLAEEMIEIDSRGGGMKDMDQMLEIEGLFDIEIPTNPQKGLTDDELLDLVKKTDEETTVANKRMLTDDEYQDFLDELGGADQLEAYQFDGTVGDSKRIIKEQKQYVDDMELEYKKGKLDPVAGDKSLARKKFLEKKFEEMEISGDKRLMTIDELEELASFDLGTDMDKAVETFKKKDLEQKKILEDFDPTFRKPNATGGLTRTSYALGKGPVLPSDEDPINPFGPKPTGPVLPDKSMMADLGDEFISPEYQEEFQKFLMMLEESDRERSMDNIMEMFKKYMLSKEPRVLKAATGGRVQAASGGLAEILKV